MQEQHDLKLFHRQDCPYSRKVRDFIEEHELREQIDYLDVDESEEAYEELQELTGDEQVPCLVIDGEPMLESDEIIEWLKGNLLEEAA